jgi:hypothetical protein
VFADEPHFAADAGKRTNTPAMGVPAAHHPSATSQPDAGDAGRYANKPSRAMEITLTVLTCGLYYVYQKFMAKNG